MPKFQLVTRIHVLTAIKVHDQRGTVDFLADLDFAGPGDLVLVERGKRYPAPALLAYAHGRATGRPLAPTEVLAPVTTKVLTDLGFTVASRAELERPVGARTAARVPGTRTPRAPRAVTPKAAPPARTVAPEPAVRLCPTCFTQLPAAGRCDFCD